MKRRLANVITGAWFAAVLMAGLPQEVQATLVPNGDFEIDGDANSAPDDWFSGGATAYLSTDDSDGNGTFSVSANNGGDWRSSAFAVIPSEQLTWSLDYKVLSGATGTFRADLRFFTGQDANGGTAGSFQGEENQTVDVAGVTPDVWHTLGPFTINVPAGSAPPLLVPNFADVRVSAGLFGPALTGELRLDNISVTRIPEPATISLVVAAGGMAWALRRRRHG